MKFNHLNDSEDTSIIQMRFKTNERTNAENTAGKS